ncbi:MAG: thiamine biosynthesis protein ThiS [Nitrospirae bacterium CG_4_9_14_0_8_um_filter_70_14]|nr:MAG: thiamine biosynthesis protein ThiS [Nitrospirae bacterium CG_4_9_14_0_8_um_filter_70_14]
MTITLNGEPYPVEPGATVGDLLARLALDPQRVVVEHNRTILDRATGASQPLNDGDEVEIVALVGGG